MLYNILLLKNLLQFRLSEDFIGFLDKWEECVKQRDVFTNTEKKLMILSSETRRGLRITGNSTKAIANTVVKVS